MKNDRLILKIDGMEPVNIKLTENIVLNHDHTGIICGNPITLTVTNVEEALMLEYMCGKSDIQGFVMTHNGQQISIIGDISREEHKFVLTIKYMKKI